MSDTLLDDGPVGLATFVSAASLGSNRKRWQLTIKSGRDIAALNRDEAFALMAALAGSLNYTLRSLEPATPKGSLVGIADEYGTVWAGEPGTSKRIGDLVVRPDDETSWLYLEDDAAEARDAGQGGA